MNRGICSPVARASTVEDVLVRRGHERFSLFFLYLPVVVWYL